MYKAEKIFELECYYALRNVPSADEITTSFQTMSPTYVLFKNIGTTCKVILIQLEVIFRPIDQQK